MFLKNDVCAFIKKYLIGNLPQNFQRVVIFTLVEGLALMLMAADWPG